jgi:hypothetical protein
METLKTINALLRTLLATIVVGGLAVGGWWLFDHYTFQDRQLSERQRQLEATQAELVDTGKQLRQARETLHTMEIELAERLVQIDRLETSLALLTVDQRLARLEVLPMEEPELPVNAILAEGDNAILAEGDSAAKQEESDPEVGQTGQHAEGGEPERPIRVRFIELSPDGDPIGSPREFRFSSEVLYIDNWIVKFDDRFVKDKDLQRGTSLCLFRRIFGEDQSPSQGYLLDEVGMRPQAYARGGQPTEFESQIWSQFWEFANNPQRAAEMGIRAANGEAVSIQVRPGMAYNIELRASGGLSITPHVQP